MFFETNDFAVNHISVFRFDWNGIDAPSGIRPYHALSYRIVGDAVFHKDAHTHPALTGDIAFVPAFCPYHITTGTESLIVIHFETDTPPANEIKIFSPKATDYYRMLFEKIYDIYCRKQTAYTHECREIFHKIVSNLERDAIRHSNDDSQKTIAPAMMLIHDRFADFSLSVGDLAAACHISEPYFRKLFLAVHGMTPHHYIHQLRLQQAIDMLRSGYFSVSETAYKCGFSSPAYFSAFIKAQTGKAPIFFTQH